MVKSDPLLSWLSIEVLCMSVAVGHVDMHEDQVVANTMLAVNFLVSLLKKVSSLLRSGTTRGMACVNPFDSLSAMAKRRFSSHQEHHGQAPATLLDVSVLFRVREVVFGFQKKEE